MAVEKVVVELDPETFGIEPNVGVMHQVVNAQLAARRAGTHVATSTDAASVAITAAKVGVSSQSRPKSA